jgi:hypothetical protein
MEFFDEHKEDLYLHRLLDTPTEAPTEALTAQSLDTTPRSRRRKHSGVWRVGLAADTADL